MRFMLAIFALCATFAMTKPAQAALMQQTTKAKQAVIIDMQTGAVLFSKSANQRMPTSSMSKVMTIYMVFEALKEGRLNLSDELMVSKKAWKKGGSKMFVEVGKTVKVEDLIRGVVIQSGNDATIVLAEGIAGDEDVFAEIMTSKAKELGMENSQFKNASGWPNPDHFSTAYDLAILAQRLINDFPQYYYYFAEKKFRYNNITQENRNPLLYKNIGADGIKTGHTEIGGYGLMTSAERDGRRLVLVVNGLDSAKDRASESARLLEWGFRAFENTKLFEKDQVIEQADVFMGQKPTVDLVIKEDVFSSVPVAKRKDIEVKIKYDAPFPAPVSAGEKVGMMSVDIPGMGLKTYPLYTDEDIGELGFMPKMMEKARIFVSSIISRRTAEE